MADASGNSPYYSCTQRSWVGLSASLLRRTVDREATGKTPDSDGQKSGIFQKNPEFSKQTGILVKFWPKLKGI